MLIIRYVTSLPQPAVFFSSVSLSASNIDDVCWMVWMKERVPVRACLRECVHARFFFPIPEPCLSDVV